MLKAGEAAAAEKNDGADGIDVVLLEKRLEGLRDTQESVQGLSLWCQANKKHSTNIIDTWLRILRKSPVEKRLTMFYLANDVVQHAKRKGDMVVVNQWAFAVQKATPHVRTPSSVSSAIARIFKIWEERSVYSKDAVADLLALLNNVSSKEKQEKKKPETYTASADKVSAFQPSDLIQKFKLAYRLKSHLGVTFRSKQFVNMDVEQLKSSIKNRNHGSEVIHEISELLDQCRTSEMKLQAEVEERRRIVETAEIAIVFYENVRGEAKIVNSAYKNFTNRVCNTKQKVDEKIQAFDEMEKDISPLPSPPAAAPSPENFPDVMPSPPVITPVVNNSWPAAMTELFQTYASGNQYSFQPSVPLNTHDVGSIPLPPPPPLPADNNTFQPPLPPLFENPGNFENSGSTSVFDNINNTPGVFDSMNNTSGVFDNMNNSSGVFDNMNNASGVFDNLNNTSGVFENLTNTAGVFENVNSTTGIFESINNSSGGRSFENSGLFENPNNSIAGFDNVNNMSNANMNFDNTNPSGVFENQPGMFENNPSQMFDNHPAPVNNPPVQQSHDQNSSVFHQQNQMPFELHQNQPFDHMQQSPPYDRLQQNNQSQSNSNYDASPHIQDHRFNYHPYNNSQRGNSPRPQRGARGKFQGRPGIRMDGPRLGYPGKFNNRDGGMNGQKDSVKDYNQFNYSNSPRGGPRGRFPNSSPGRGFSRRGGRF